MKILFLGDYSGLHATLADALRRMGHDCIVVSSGSRCMDTRRDIDLRRKPGIVGSIKYLAQSARIVSSMRGFDVVQLINPCYLHLRPGKLRYFFDLLKKNNRAVGLTLAGFDSFFVRELVEGQWLRYSELSVGGKATPYAELNRYDIDTWLGSELTDYCRYVYENIDGAVSVLYEYDITARKYLADKVYYAGIPIDIDRLKYSKSGQRGKLRILAAYKSEYKTFKGSDILERAALRVAELHPERVTVDVACDMPLEAYLRKMEEVDIVLDQLYSYTPATNALQAMAMGKIVVSGGENEYYDFIGERNLKPVINVVPGDESEIERVLERLVLSTPSELDRLSTQGRTFVQKHNASEVVAKRFIEAWEKMAK